MSELDWEVATDLEPEMPVPVVQNWIGPALRDWNNAIYPPRRGVTVVWGCVFVVPWAIFQAIKFWVWLTGIAFVLVVGTIFALKDLVTYRNRRRKAVLGAWIEY